MPQDASPVRDSRLTARRGLWLLLAVVLAIVALLGLRLTQALSLKKTVTNKVAIPTVSVIEAGVSTIPTTIEIIGAIVARYDMPIGVESEAGHIAAISSKLAITSARSGACAARYLGAGAAGGQPGGGARTGRAEAALADADYRRADAIAPPARSRWRRRNAAIDGGDGCGKR